MNNFPKPPDFKQNFVFMIKRDDRIKFGRFGFSILSFLLHWIPSILRSDYYNTACIIGVDACIYMATHMFLQLVLNVDPSNSMNIMYFIGSVIWGLFYNTMYIKRLVNKGFRPIDVDSKNVLKEHRIDCELTDMTPDEINHQGPML